MIRKFVVVVLCSVLVFVASANTTQAKAKVNNKHYNIIEKRLDNIDSINGDIYIITMKNGKVNKLMQVN